MDRIRKVKQQIGEPKIQTPAPSTQLRLAGSPVYKNLTLQILRKNLARQFLKVDRSRVERIFVWPENPRLRLQLQQALNQKIESAPSQIGKNDLLIAFVRTKSEARRLSSLSPQILSRTLVVNQVEPGILSGSYYQKIEIYLDHPALAWEVGKRLNSRWKPRLAAGR